MTSDRNQGRDEFYVGYFPEMPAGLRRFLRSRVGIILGVALLVTLILAWNQAGPAPAVFEFGTIRPITGVFRERPYPLLFTRDSSGNARTWLLAAEYKHGADRLVAGLHQKAGRVDVTRIYRGELGMLELHGVPELVPGGAPAPVDESDLGETTLTGEIVDSKCWLGVMNPGEGPTHRLCALRCLRGGLPPLFAGRTAAGDSVVALMVGPGGGRIDGLLLPHVATQVSVTGRLRTIGTLLVLESEPTSIQRITR